MGSAFNAVRFRVKPGREKDLLEAHRTIVAVSGAVSDAVVLALK